MADKGKRMIFEDEYQYLKDLKENHEDPTAEWGGGGVSIIDVNTYVMQETPLPDDIYNEIINNSPYLKADSGVLGVSSYYHLTEERDQYLIFEVTNEVESHTMGTDPDIFEAEILVQHKLRLNRTTKIMSRIDFNKSLLTVNSTPSENVKVLKNIKLGGGSTTTYEIPTPTVVSANTGATPTATLTDLQVGTVTYEVPQGGSADIDNKTIIKNQNDELETAIGGWKTSEITDLNFTLTAGAGYDYSIVDSTLANKIYNALKSYKKYPVTMTFTDSTATKTITSAYVFATSVTTTQFGGSGTLKAIDSNNSSHNWEFYANISNNKVNVYLGDGFARNGTLTISFSPIATWDYINMDAIPDITQKIKIDQSLKFDVTLPQEGDPVLTLGQNVSYNSPLSQGTAGSRWVINFNYDPGSFELINDFGRNTSIANVKGTTGQYANLIETYKNIDWTTSNNLYTFSNNDYMVAIAKVLLDKELQGQSYSIRTAFGNAQSSLTGYRPTVSGNTYTYNRTSGQTIRDFVFTVNQDNSITINTPLTIYSTIATPEIIRFFDLPPTNGIVRNKIDKKFIPLVSDIPDAPTTQGTYTLQVTVDAQGNPTYSWV